MPPQRGDTGTALTRCAIRYFGITRRIVALDDARCSRVSSFLQCLYPPALHSKLGLLDVRSQRWNLHVYSVSLMLEAMLNFAECECWKVLWNCEEMTG